MVLLEARTARTTHTGIIISDVMERMDGSQTTGHRFFTPSAWSYDETTAQWYLHLFSGKQPDLNWENPELRQEIYGMMNRWLDRGADGFRMDVISLLAKDPQLPDGTGSGYMFSPKYFAFQPRLHDYLREMRRECFDGRDCMCVGETSLRHHAEHRFRGRRRAGAGYAVPV